MAQWELIWHIKINSFLERDEYIQTSMASSQFVHTRVNRTGERGDKNKHVVNMKGGEYYTKFSPYTDILIKKKSKRWLLSDNWLLMCARKLVW